MMLSLIISVKHYSIKNRIEYKEENDMKKQDGTVSNEKDYKKLTKKLNDNQGFFKDLDKKVKRVSDENQEHIKQLHDKNNGKK